MAKEFARERRWKATQARRTAKAVAKSGRDVESRAAARIKEEHDRLRATASWVAKEVGRFWTKAHKVVEFTQQRQIESKRKELLDKHLSLLVGQTQRYSTLLADRLQGRDGGREGGGGRQQDVSDESGEEDCEGGGDADVSDVESDMEADDEPEQGVAANEPDVAVQCGQEVVLGKQHGVLGLGFLLLEGHGCFEIF